MASTTMLANDGMRPASFLPAIKCSNCGDEIEIASMGDHICNKAPPSPKAQAPSMNPFTLRQMNANGIHTPSPLGQSNPDPPPQTRVRAPTLSSKPLPAPKATRAAPPYINPDAANRPFLAPKPPRSDSPMSPALSMRSGSSMGGSRPPVLRSMTSPAPRIFDPRPPSPEMSANLDCAFPPFPGPSSSGSGSRPGTSSGRGTPPTQERAHSRSATRQESRRPSNFETRSPLAGPFEPEQRRPSMQQYNSDMPLDRRRPSMSSIKFNSGPPPIPTEPIPRPSTAYSVRSQPSKPRRDSSTNFSRPDPQPPQKKAPPPRPERPTKEVLSPNLLGTMSMEPVMDIPSTFSLSQPPVPLRSADRSKTFPQRQGSTDEPEQFPTLERTPTEPQMRGRRPTLTAANLSEPSQIPQSQQRARSQSRSGQRMDNRLQDAPPVPKPVQQHRQEGRHTPSGSGSSTASSMHSMDHGSSIGPSPVGSAASSIDAFSALSYGSDQYGSLEEGMRVAGLNVKAQQQQKPGMRAEQPAQRSPPRNFARPSPTRQDVQRIPSPQPPVTMPTAFASPLESPMDPAMQSAQPTWQSAAQPLALPQLTRTQTSPLPETPTEPQQGPPGSQPPTGYFDHQHRRPSQQQDRRARSKSNAGFLRYEPFSPNASTAPLSPPTMPMPPLPPVPSIPFRSRTPLSRKSTTARPICRGCSKPIEGKSVKAADGRLTGRWHKACFKCRTCDSPFTTADFYVIDNHPYCEQHYHEANGSLCHGCNRGIEGQYLETTSSSSVGGGDKKFHPRCFTCFECREVLAEDYFEIGGKVFCERHALAAMRGHARMAGGGGGPGLGGLLHSDRKALTAERRTTKLMMM